MRSLSRCLAKRKESLPKKYLAVRGARIALFLLITSSSFPPAVSPLAYAADVREPTEDLESLLNSENVPSPDLDGNSTSANTPKFNESGAVGKTSSTASDSVATAHPEEDQVDFEKALQTGPSKNASRATAAAEVSKSESSSTEITPAAESEKIATDPTTASANSGRKNEITNLEFRMDGDQSRITITFKSSPTFREVRNEAVKQVVYYFDNTESPQRLQRAYDTSEFISPVTLFTLLQMPDNPPASKLIVQLREDKTPTPSVSGNSLVVTLPASDIKPDAKSLAKKDGESSLSSEHNIYEGNQTFSGKSIGRLEIKNSDIQDVLRLIAKTSGYNIVVGDDVQGRMGTLSLENIPWDQAFTLVLQSKKLGYIRQGNVLRVGTLLTLKTEKDEALANELARIKTEPLRTLLIPISYAKAQDLAPRARSFLSERGVVETDARTNTLIIKDVDRFVTKIQKLVSALDTQPPHVSISAKIVEMDTDFTRNIGFSNFSFSPTLGGINIGSSFLSGVSGTNVATITAPNFANLSANLQLGEVDNRVKVLANPQVSVVANQAATINQSLAFFIPVTTIVNATPQISYNQVTTNLTLDVTPIVSNDGVIFLTLNIQNQTPNGPINQRTIDGRSVQTQVMVDNGDTAVIGGIFSSTVTMNHDAVPFLSNIPILGLLFTGNAYEDKKNEIYIFLTAKILNADETFKRTL